MLFTQLLDRIGFNNRVFTFDDFHYCCQEMNVMPCERYMKKWKGLYTVCDGVKSIVVNDALSEIEKLEVSFHELGHAGQHSHKTSFYCKNAIPKTEYQAQVIPAVALIPRFIVESMLPCEIQEEFGLPMRLITFRKRVYEHKRI